VHAFNLCLDELFTNIVSYGYPGGGEHTIELDLRADAVEAVAILRDDARAFDPLTQAPHPDLNAPIESRKIGGLGVYFVKVLMTRVSYRREGRHNVLEMARARDWKPA
jgi:anti-sigma regulatory factor (Ser/Thr protein kinase)